MDTDVLDRNTDNEAPPDEPPGDGGARGLGRPRPRTVIIAVAAGAVALALMVALAPWPRGLSSTVTGDPELAAQAEAALDPGIRRNLAVVRISDGQVTHAGFGADEHTEFEVGSLTKTFTTALFADAIERGEVQPDTTVGDVWPAAAGDAATITLEELASHRSGLSPIVLNDPGLAWSASWRNILRLDPYTKVTTAAMVDNLPTESLESRGTMVYSNYGMALLGQSLAEVTGRSYADLLQERILTPLGMTETYLPQTRDGLRPGAPRGLAAQGLPAGPWTAGDSSPVGGLRSTTADMTTYLRAVMDGAAPGTDAVTPRFPADPEGHSEIGYAWFTEHTDGRTVHWHNGITGGFTSFMGFDPESGDGVIVLNDTKDVVDLAGFTLLTEGA